VFPVRYELNSYILFRRNSVFKGLIKKLEPRINKVKIHKIKKLELFMLCHLRMIYNLKHAVVNKNIRC
jgi:hypothetical protein